MLKNTTKIYTYDFFRWFLVMMPVLIPYYEHCGLNMHQIYQLQAFFAILVVLFEIPSGYFADLFGRKVSLIIGALFIGLGHSYFLVVDQFWEFMVHKFILAIAFSFISGSDLAMLYDSAKEENPGSSRQHTTRVLAHWMFLLMAAESSASLLGGFLAAQFSFKLAIIVNAATSWLPLLISFFLYEPKVERLDRREHRKNFQQVFHYMFVEDHFVRIVTLNLIGWGLLGFVAVWLFQKYWIEVGVPLGWFGVLWAAYNLTAGVVGKQINHFEHKFGLPPLILIIGIGPVLGYLVMAGSMQAAGWLGVIFGFAFYISRGVNQVLLRDLMNYRMPSKFRATANSVTSFSVRGVFAIVGPAVGFMIDRVGLRETMFTLGGFAVAAMLLLTWPLFRLVRQLGIDEKDLHSKT